MVCRSANHRALCYTQTGESRPLPEMILMQILHPFAGSLTRYAEEISDPDRCRRDPLRTSMPASAWPSTTPANSSGHQSARSNLVFECEEPSAGGIGYSSQAHRRSFNSSSRKMQSRRTTRSRRWKKRRRKSVAGGSWRMCSMSRCQRSSGVVPGSCDRCGDTRRARPTGARSTPRGRGFVCDPGCPGTVRGRSGYVVIAVMWPRILNEPGFATSDGNLRHIS